MIIRTARGLTSGKRSKSCSAALRWRLSEYREQLEAHPDAIELPIEQVERGDVLVAEIDGDIAGFAALEGGELDGLFVEPARWREGIGRALVEAAVQEARRRGLSLTVTAGPGARAFLREVRVQGRRRRRDAVRSGANGCRARRVF